MVINVGIISAMVLYKRNPKSITRLTKLINQQKQRPSKQVTVHEFPLKCIFSVLIILLFLGFLQHFKNQCQIEMKQKIFIQNNEGTIISLNIQQIFPQNQTTAVEHISSDKSDGKQQKSTNQEFENVRKTVNAILIVGGFLILGLIGSAQLKCVKATKAKRQIVITIYSIFGVNNRVKIPIGSGSQLRIYQTGEWKFTFNDFHYELRLINQNWKQQNTEVFKVICNKSSIFHARKAIILLSSVLGLQIDQKIYKVQKQASNSKKKNNPSKQKTKSPSVNDI